MVKCVLFIKTILLIIVSGIIIDYWNVIIKCMLVKKSNKYYINIIKKTNNLNTMTFKKVDTWLETDEIFF